MLQVTFQGNKNFEFKLFGSDLAKVKQAIKEYGDMSFSHRGQCLEGILA